MQEYRINYTLLIGLIVGTLICSGAIFGIHEFQRSRQSGWLVNEAEKAAAEKNYAQAAQYYAQFISIHPKDVEAKTKLADAYLDLLEQDNPNPEDVPVAMQSLETMLRNPALAAVPEAKDIRRRLVTFYGKDTTRLYTQALDHLKFLLDDPKNANDPELLVLRATYLAKSGNIDDATKYSYKLIGYDSKKDAFDAKSAAAPSATEVYATLAGVLRDKSKKPELAARVANQMVDVNPKDAKAYLSRGRLLAQWGNADESRADAEKAYQLKPEDPDVLLLVSEIAIKDKNYDKAREYIEAAKKLHSKDARIYQQAAYLEMQQGKLDKALAEFDAGVKAMGSAAGLNLLFYKARAQLESNDVTAARQTLEDMKQSRRLPPELNEYFEAKFLVRENKWYPAVEALSKLRPRLTSFPREMTTEIDFDLGLCYERLARFELAKQYYDLIVQQDPKNAPALAGKQRCETYLGLDKTKTTTTDPLQAKIAAILKLPKDQQDWTEINRMVDDTIEKNKQLTPVMAALFKAQIALMHDDFDAATKIVKDIEKTDPKNAQIKRFKLQLARLNPNIGAAKALEYWQLVANDLGDLPGVRLDKAEILLSLNKDKQDKEQLKQDLASLASGIDKWTPPQKAELWGGLARVYINLGMMDEARQYLNLVADAQPQELPVRLDLFSMALDANDEEGMKSAQEKILQVVNNDKNDSAWLYAEARRKIWLMTRGQLGREALPEVRALVKRALDQRPDQGELHALLGEIELISNNAALALKNFDKAEELGRIKPTTVAAHIKLLYMYGRYADAGKLLDRIPEQARQTLLGPLYAEILFQTKQVDAAIEQAKAATVANPDNAQSHYWYSKLLARSAQDAPEGRRNETLAKATESMTKAIQLQPEFAEGWFALINYYLIQGKENEAQKAMRDAQLALSGDDLAMFLAKSYEALRRWFDAETMYREVYEVNPNDLQRAQQLAAFYLGPVYQRPDRRDKVTPLINQLLKAGADGKLPQNDPNLLWARRKAAGMLAETRDYQNSVKAERLLASNTEGLLIEDKLLMAEILGRRPEPISRKKAIGLLEEVSQVQKLSEANAILLAELYFVTRSDWSKYQSEMEKVIARYSNSARARETYARRLLARGDAASIDKATKLVGELRQLAPNYPPTFELTVRIADKLGKQKQVADELRRRLPNLEDPGELDPATKQTAVMFASLLSDLKDYDGAEKILRSLTARDPSLTYELLKFVGTRRSPEQCFEKLNELYSPENIPKILDAAMTVAREQRDKVGDKFDSQIQKWIDAGLRENPGAVSLLVVQADLYDLQKRYDAAAKVYKELLGRKELVGLSRAVVLNNLAFLEALAGKGSSTGVEPLKLIAEAAEILGPSPDILDTRAVVLNSLGRYKEAVTDLDLSVTDNPTASKYFHLVQARLGAKESRAAVEAWEKAEALKLSRESLNRMEHDEYDRVKGEIDKIRGASVTKADPVRKAG